MTLTEALLQISELTEKNIKLLTMINDSFYTKANHLTTNIDGAAYTIPSYIALENKVNHLQDAFNNLVHAAKSGEAWFNFDGNSKVLNVAGYQQAPNPIQLKAPRTFQTEAATLFKDMLNPRPYINFEINSLPDDITQVVVKKFVIYNEDAFSELISMLDPKTTPSVQLNYEAIKSVLMGGNNQPNVDYYEYDTVYDMPLRHNTYSGTFFVEKVIKDYIDANLDNVIKVKIHQATPLELLSFDGSTTIRISNNSTVDAISEQGIDGTGLYLTTFDGSAKLKVLEIGTDNTLTLQVMSSEYVNIVGTDDIIVPDGKRLEDVVSDYSKLCYYAMPTRDRYVHVPLEEDKYVFISIAPVNSRINTQTTWGSGVLICTDYLRKDVFSDEAEQFRSYYNQNVSNIGDCLNELTNVLFPSISMFSEDQYAQLKQAPELTTDTLQVVQINKHLNDSAAVKQIRSLYSQKKQYQIDLKEVQAKIASLNEQLAEISFDDMSGTRSAYTAQLADLKDQQNNLTTSISKITDDISRAANDATIPIEAGKYRVRGYLDVDGYLATNAASKANPESWRKYILGIQVQYRYKNPDSPQANVAVIKDFLFTEWSEYNPPLRPRTMTYKNGIYSVEFNDLASDKFNLTANELKFNQIDVPISQGEVVEIRARILWGFGHPFVTTATDWSENLEITFPEDLIKDVQVTTILEENNSDIETNRFETILRTKGIEEHVDSSMQDQDITYYHRPEDIASGFYTPERRVVPLKDKLLELSNNLQRALDEIEGTSSESLEVSVIVDNINNVISPDVNNTIQLPAINQIRASDAGVPSGSAFMDSNGQVTCTPVIRIANKSNTTVRIFSLFPGPKDLNINAKKQAGGSYVGGDGDFIVPAIIPNALQVQNFIFNNLFYIDENQKCKIKKQSAGQFLYFRNTNPFTMSSDKFPAIVDSVSTVAIGGTDVLDNGMVLDEYVAPMVTSRYIPEPDDEYANGYLKIVPMLSDPDLLNIKGDSASMHLVLAPSQAITIGLGAYYMLKQGGERTAKVAFNIRTSPYKDPLYYEILFAARHTATTADLLNSAKASTTSSTRYNTAVR